MMKIQQHDGVVVDAAMIAAGLRQAPQKRRKKRRRAAPTRLNRVCVGQPP